LPTEIWLTCTHAESKQPAAHGEGAHSPPYVHVSSVVGLSHCTVFGAQMPAQTPPMQALSSVSHDAPLGTHWPDALQNSGSWPLHRSSANVQAVQIPPMQ
jgi:hypothetical protein